MPLGNIQLVEETHWEVEGLNVDSVAASRPVAAARPGARAAARLAGANARARAKG